MIQLIKDLPEYITGIEISGEVSKHDYDTIVVPRLNELAKQQGEINYLVVLKSGIASFEAGVWWDDFKMAVKQFSNWGKIAIVSDDDPIKNVTNLLGFAFPGHPRGFKLDEYTQAVEWVKA
ncbi:STAS/SEC14 domain-containing protein [Mucilaginibacter litoreus]|uniref:STAS/SEC14 domain-containing protein n=1 Tax=Mucilaginibacter litoreus TaxID=1048221 RepID=A0ABW3AYA2_9SPHI